MRDVPCGEAVWLFEVSQHSRLWLSTELGRQQLGDVTLPSHLLQLLSLPHTSLPGPPFLGPRGAEQPVDAGTLLSSIRDAWDMELKVDPGD